MTGASTSVPKPSIDLKSIRRVAVLAMASALALPLGIATAAAPLTPPAGASTAAAQPQATTATYGAWTLRCVTAPPSTQSGGKTAPGTAAPQCEIDQQIIVQGQSAPIAVLAIGLDPATAGLHLVAQLPVGVWLPAPPVFGLTATATPVPLSYRRCLQGACFADVDIDATLETGMRQASASGLLGFQITAGKDIGLPISFNGFGAALDALKSR
jgi:invasion protein IalB